MPVECRDVRGRHLHATHAFGLTSTLGIGDAAATIRDLYLGGKKNEAIAAVPDALVDEVALVGDRARIADRVAAFRDSGVTTLVLQARQPAALRLLADLSP